MMRWVRAGQGKELCLLAPKRYRVPVLLLHWTKKAQKIFHVSPIYPTYTMGCPFGDHRDVSQVAQKRGLIWDLSGLCHALAGWPLASHFSVPGTQFL